jgi:predicted DNA-binding transcriptional regulator YafY
MAATRTQLLRSAGKNREQVRIEYTDRRGKQIVRTVRPYEIRGGMLWATDTRHGAGHIHSFKMARVRSAATVGRKYRPRWEVKL